MKSTQKQDKASTKEQGGSSQGNIKVVCRVRPPNKNELAQFEQGLQRLCIDFFPDEKTIKLNMTEQEKHQFTFDRIFGDATTQQAIYDYSAKPVVQSVLEGYNGTVFAYGQTSSGKTHTMQGPSITDHDHKGIIPRMVTTVFQHVNTSPNHIEFKIKISIVEIYLEKIKDLLDPVKSNLTVREDRTHGVYIQDVTEKYVTSEKEVFNIIDQGNQNRSVAYTHMNEGSSRSHMLFIMTVYQNNLQDLSAKTGKLFLVDLAGSEKISKTGAEGKTLDEAKKINQSLSCLDGKSSHVPYRDSKLTRVLQESLGGNSTTTLIITCSPSSFNDQETLSTLRFGMRAKSIKNKPKINREYTIQELQLLLLNQEKIIEEQKKTIRQLEKQLANGNYVSKAQIQEVVEESQTQQDTSADNIEPEDAEATQEETQPTLDRTMELEAQLEAEKAKCSSYAYQLNQAKNEMQDITSQMETYSKENEMMSNKLTNLAFMLNDLETEMINNKFSMEKSQASKQQMMQQISSFKKIHEQYKSQFAGSLHCNFNKNQRIVDLVGDDIHQINKDILLTCQTKLSEEEFKLFLNQMIVQKNTNQDDVPLQEYNKLQEELDQEKESKQQASQELKNALEENAKLLKIQEQLQADLKSRNSIEGAQANKELNEIQLNKERQQFKLAKEKILVDLKEKVNNVLTLEKELENQKQITKKFEDELEKKEQGLQFKVEYLEKNLERMTTMYENLISKAMLDKRQDDQDEQLKKKEKKILKLESQLNQSQNKISKFKNKIKKIQNKNDEDRTKSLSSQNILRDINDNPNQTNHFQLSTLIHDNYDDRNDTDKSQINRTVNSSDFSDSQINSSSDADLDEDLIQQIDGKQSKRKDFADNDQQESQDNRNNRGIKNQSIFHETNKNRSMSNYSPTKFSKHRNILQIQLEDDDNRNNLNNSYHNDNNNSFRNINLPKHKIKSQIYRNRQQVESIGPQTSHSLNASIDYGRSKKPTMTFQKIQNQLGFDIQEVDDDNVSEAYNNMNNPQNFAFGNKNMNNQQHNQQLNNILPISQHNTKQLPVKVSLNAQGLNLTQSNINHPYSTQHSFMIDPNQSRRRWDENNGQGGQGFDDNDYYNILKSTETEPNVGSEIMTSSMKITPITPRQQQQQQQTLSTPKNLSLQDYMMNQQKSLIQNAIQRKNTNNYNTSQVNTTETSDSTKNNNNKKITASDILRGNPTLSPFINTFSFKLLNLQTNCIYAF